MAWVAHALGQVLLAIVLGSVVFTALAYFGAARHRRRHPPACPADVDEETPWPARVVAAVRSFIVECGLTAVLVVLTPFGMRRRPRLRSRGGDTERHPVVLLHGYAQHSANFLWLARRLRRDGWHHVYSIAHTPVLGDLERSAARLGGVLDDIRHACSASAVDVVAHSMGGLVARAYVHARGSASGIGRLVTLGTPHQGTEVLRWLARDPMVAQMRPEAAFVRGLAEHALPPSVDCVSIYSVDDAIVVPPGAAYWPGAFNIEIRGVGHHALLFSRRVYELLRENLAAPLTPRAA